MADEKVIAEKVIALISDMTGVDEKKVTMGQTLACLNVDDFGLIDIMMDLEDVFEVVVDDDIHVRTVDDIVQCLYEAQADHRISIGSHRHAHTA